MSDSLQHQLPNLSTHQSTTTPIREWIRTDSGLWVPTDQTSLIIGVPEHPLVPTEGTNGSGGLILPKSSGPTANR